MKKTAIVILGSDRSGTSVLAGILHMLGIYMGKSFIPATEANPKGFYENKDITEFNDKKLLPIIKSSWGDIEPIHVRVINNLLKRNDLITEAINIIEHHYSYEIIFGFKDPRVANLFPFWERILKILEIEIKIIIPYRDPIEVALSLQKRAGLNIEKGLLLWAKRSLYAEYYSRNYKRVFINYDDLLERTEEVIKTIADTLDIEYPNKYEEVKYKIKDFLDINLKHYSKKNLGIADYKFNFVKEAKELFEKLISGSIKDENYVREKFNLIRNEFNSYAYETELTQQKSKNEELLNEFSRTKEEKTQLEAKVQVLETELSQQKSKNEELLNEFSRTKEEKTQLEAKVQVLETELSQQKSKNEELLNELVRIYLSKSWKVTRPLRWLRRKLKI